MSERYGARENNLQYHGKPGPVSYVWAYPKPNKLVAMGHTCIYIVYIVYAWMYKMLGGYYYLHKRDYTSFCYGESL